MHGQRKKTKREEDKKTWTIKNRTTKENESCTDNKIDGMKKKENKSRMDNEKIDPQKENESLTEKIKIKKIMNGEKKRN